MNGTPIRSERKPAIDARPEGNRFPKRVRLLNSPEFRAAFQTKQYAADATLVVNVAPNQRNYCRLGLAVSRKVGNAVVRNRWKRALREAFRHHQHRLPPGWDVVVRPRAGAELDTRRINESLPSLVKRATRRGRATRGKAKP